jgi:hypothetical protein
VRLLTGGGRIIPVLGRRPRAFSTGLGLGLIAVGAVLLFAVPSGSPGWINLHVVGVILIIVGVLGLLLPTRLWGAGLVAGDQTSGGLAGFINPSGIDDPAVHSDQLAAEQDAALIREDAVRFDPHGPESASNDL